MDANDAAVDLKTDDTAIEQLLNLFAVTRTYAPRMHIMQRKLIALRIVVSFPIKLNQNYLLLLVGRPKN